jgi:hypothetical protein
MPDRHSDMRSRHARRAAGGIRIQLGLAAILETGCPGSHDLLMMEKFMTPHVSKAPPIGTESETANPFDIFAKHDGFWWPFRTVSKALLRTQRNTAAYLEANRRLIDEMRNMVRKEQDLAVEISESIFKALSKSSKAASGGAALDPKEVNEMFDRAMTGMRELSEAWVDVQVRSLDAMRSYTDAGQKNAAKPVHIDAEAA